MFATRKNPLRTAEMVLESTPPENSCSSAGVVLQDLEGRPAGILRAASPTSALSSAGASSVRKSALPNATTWLSESVVVGARRVSADAAEELGQGIWGRHGGAGFQHQSFDQVGRAGGRASVGGRSRQDSGNRLDVVSPAGAGTEEITRKGLAVSRRAGGASSGGGGTDGMAKKPDRVPRRRGSGAGGNPPVVPEVAGKMAEKKGKRKEAGIAPPISVLIVEDNPINQTILPTFIKRKKIKCEVAQNGLQAVESGSWSIPFGFRE
ncbi:ssk1 response regulator receiver [Ceratobasidium sp. 394]|nr:ssk1 response regulator receiver [Ceratobasidium sp. 394]